MRARSVGCLCMFDVYVCGMYVRYVACMYSCLPPHCVLCLQIGMCGTASPGERMSVLAVYNRWESMSIVYACNTADVLMLVCTVLYSTAFGGVLSREMQGFQRLFRYILLSFLMRSCSICQLTS